MKAFFEKVKYFFGKLQTALVAFFGRYPRRVYSTVALCLVVLVLVVDLGYHLVNGLSSKVETLTAKVTTMTRSVSSDAYLILDEKPLNEAGGKYLYLVEDGTRVANGTPLAAVYPDGTNREALSALESLYRAKAVLEDAVHNRPEKISETLKLKIDGVMLSIEKALTEGNIEKAERLQESLALFAFCREKLEGALSLDEAMASLDADIATVESIVGSPIRTVTAEETGWFVRSSDGYEAFASSASVSSMSYTDLAALFDLGEISAEETVGRMITSHRFFLVTFVSTEEAQSFGANRQYDLTYDGEEMTLTLEKILYQNGKDEVALLFGGTSLSEAISLRRIAGISLTVEEYEGFKLPTAALTQLDGVYGVYILKGFVVEFREIEILYREENTILAAESPSSPSNAYKLLAENDNVIIRGEDLYDKKIIQ